MTRSLVRRHTLGSVIKTSYSLLFTHFGKLLGGAMVVMAPWQVMDWFVKFHTTANDVVLVSLTTLILIGMQLAVPVLLLQINDVVRGLQPSVRRSLKIYLSDRLKPFLATSIVVGIAVSVGFVLLIIPGLIISAFYLFAMIIATLEGKGVTESMRKSRALGKGFYVRNLCVLYLSMFAVGLPIIFVYILFAAALGGTAGYLFPEAAMDGPLIEFVVLFIQVLGAVVALPLALPQILIYYDMRARKEGLDDHRFVEELELAGFDADSSEKRSLGWKPVQL